VGVRDRMRKEPTSSKTRQANACSLRGGFGGFAQAANHTGAQDRRRRSAFRGNCQPAIIKTRRPQDMSALERPRPVRRYERATPGEIIHIGNQKAGQVKADTANRSPAIGPANATHRGRLRSRTLPKKRALMREVTMPNT